MLENKKIRQPIVTVMGHVDHGKTTFLDAIRSTDVQQKEEGGITQNTRAHEFVSNSGFRVTFIDTPGHEAFSKMRERGAHITDIVLLVVSATDGIQPQTKECIEFAKKSKTPIIIAVNKIDLPGGNIEKIKPELSSFGLSIEEYGGDTLYFEMSALKKEGIDNVIEGIELLSEMLELKSKKTMENTLGEAFVLESALHKQLGNVALCLLKAGHLQKKSNVIAEDNIYKIRAYLDENQELIEEVHESQPFWLTGIKENLKAGSTIYFADQEDRLKQIQENIFGGRKKEQASINSNKDPESLFAKMLLNREEKKLGVEQKELNVILRASTEGTLEAITAQLLNLNTEDSKVRLLVSGTGEVTESDIFRAKIANAIIVTFQLPLPSKIAALSKREKVLVRNYEIIYELVDEIADVLDSMEYHADQEIEVATATVKQVFVLSNGDIVAGCEVVSGTLLKGYKVMVKREDEELGRGKITSLRVLKNEVKEVRKGQECGILIEPKLDILEEGDEIIAYRLEKTA